MECQKALFQLDPDVHYLNCAYQAPLLRAAEAACIEALVRARNPFRIEAKDFFEETEIVRALFGRLVNADPPNIALIPSTSYGLASVLNNIAGKSKGKAIILKDEFPSAYFSLERWCREKENQLLIVGPESNSGRIGKQWNQRILEQIDDRTSVVLLSSAHWMNGLRFDLKAIGQRCREVGAKFLVDGTQSVGVLPIDVQDLHIDALICATYKWLLGPYSIGLACFSDEFEHGIPLEETWMNRTNSLNFSDLANYDPQYKPKAGRYNVGETSHLLLMPILRLALEQIEAWGPANIQQYCRSLVSPLIGYLEGLGVVFEDPSCFSHHLFSLSLPPQIDRERLRNELIENRIYTSLRGEHLRVSVHAFNDRGDLEKLREVIAALLSD